MVICLCNVSPCDYRGELQGVCGNFDDDKGNDRVMSGGQATEDIGEFVDSWMIPSEGEEYEIFTIVIEYNSIGKLIMFSVISPHPQPLLIDLFPVRNRHMVLVLSHGYNCVLQSQNAISCKVNRYYVLAFHAIHSVHVFLGIVFDTVPIHISVCFLNNHNYEQLLTLYF